MNLASTSLRQRTHYMALAKRCVRLRCLDRAAVNVDIDLKNDAASPQAASTATASTPDKDPT